MICIGHSTDEKLAAVAAYRAAHDIRRTFVIAPAQFPLAVPDADAVAYTDVIMYVTYYRLLQEIDTSTLLVIHECLRTQNRYDLTYNCIRNYLNQTSHQLVFQTLPQIDTHEDFMILFDFDTRSRWKRRPFDAALVRDQAQVQVCEMPVSFGRIDVPTGAATKERYEREREQRFAELGARDPNTIPRNLHLLGGRDKAAWIEAQSVVQPSLLDAARPAARRYVARNRRLSRADIDTYETATAERAPYTVVDCPHRFIDWCDFVARTGQAHADVLAADLKVDHWYYDRLAAWGERVHATYADLH